jgi:hypothetical protein
LTAMEEFTQVDSTSLDIQILHDPFEQQNPFPNHSLLASIAKHSGGQVIDDASQLAEVLRNVPMKVGAPVTKTTPLWMVVVAWLIDCRMALAASCRAGVKVLSEAGCLVDGSTSWDNARVAMLQFLFVLQSVVLGQAEANVEPKQRPPWLELAQAHLKNCEVFPTRDADHPFAIRPEPVFHHVQSVRHTAVGSVFLWLEDSGRPAAVGDVFFLPSGKNHTLYNEWHSLTSVPITVKWNGGALMSCTTAGLKWNDIPAAGPPAEKDVQRERQIRQVARRFTGRLVDKKGDKYELRLLTTPLYQYHAKGKAEFTSGAIFAFCQETDPEIFLLIEGHPAEGGPRWEYAAAEFSNLNLFLQLDAKEVWSANPPQFSSQGPHVGGPLKDVVLPTEPNAPKNSPR